MNNTKGGNHTEIDGPNDPEWYATIIFGIIIALITISANLGAMVDISRKKKRLPFHYYLINLTAVDMLTGLFAQPNMVLLNYYNGVWPLDEGWCSFWIFFDVFVNAVSFVMLVVISGDRLFAVAYPVQYQQHSSRNQVGVVIAISWAVVAVPFMVNFIKFRLLIRHPEPACNFIDYDFLTGPGLLSTIIAIYMPPILITFNYIVLSALMLKRLAKRRIIVPRLSIQAPDTLHVPFAHDARSRSQSLRTTLAESTININPAVAQKALTSRDRKPFRLLAYLIFFFYITCVPMVIFTFMWTRNRDLPDTAPTSFVAVYWLQYLNSMINPFLYALAEKDLVGNLLRKISKKPGVLKHHNEFG